MIKIDGEKIKKLRESQGLTQLYMATAVEVTTDTISRWENKRYPTIKEENAEKLAETLGVDLNEILLVDDEAEAGQEEPVEITISDNGQPVRRKFPKSLLFAGVVGIIVIVSAASLLYNRHDIADIISVNRIMPSSAIPDSPFPVVIEIQHAGNEAISIILKEILPPGSEVVETSPTAGSSADNLETKWIHKLNGTTRFSYLVKLNGATNEEYKFNGTVSTSGKKSVIEVSGNNSIQLGKYHWADSNGDNRISDQEILTVFDYYSGIDDFTIDIEFIEKMWLGSSYTWDSEKKHISISP